MDDIDTPLAALLKIPERAPDVGFANEVNLRIDLERNLAARLADERGRTATLLVSTLALAIGLWLFAQGSAFTAAYGTSGDLVGLMAMAGVMLLWLGTAGAGSLASD